MDDAEEIMYLINVKYCKGNSDWRTGYDKCQGIDSIEAVNEIIPMSYIIRHEDTKELVGVVVTQEIYKHCQNGVSQNFKPLENNVYIFYGFE